MRFEPTRIPEVIIVRPDVFRDARGFFLESYNLEKYRVGGIDGQFVQDNHSFSVLGTLRGLHSQREFPQSKLVRCIEGEIWDVAVDVRRGSPTFGQWVAVTLTAEKHEQIYIPGGFAHGFTVLSERAQVEYKVTGTYRPDDEISIIWNDPQLAIEWPVDEPILSEKDAACKSLAEMMERLPVYPGSPK